jgi:hypothetical protein
MGNAMPTPDAMVRKDAPWALSIQNCAISINFHNVIDATSSAVVSENSESGEKPPEFALTHPACFAKFVHTSHMPFRAISHTNPIRKTPKNQGRSDPAGDGRQLSPNEPRHRTDTVGGITGDP